MHALVIAVVMGGVFTTVVLGFGPLAYRAMGGREGALAAAVTYSNVVFAGAVAPWLFNSLGSIIRGSGNMTMPAIVMVATGLVQLVLCPVLVLGLAGNFMLGALMTLGIGLYAPCMILVSLLGMNSLTAYPIMMGSCAFLMPVASARFVQKHAYARRPALALAIGGIPAVLIALLWVQSLDVTYVRWLVVVVVTIAATMMLRSAAKGE